MKRGRKENIGMSCKDSKGVSKRGPERITAKGRQMKKMRGETTDGRMTANRPT